MSGVEVIAVVACVAAVISAYHDGSHVFQDIRRKWRERRNSHPQAASATDLENSLQRSRDDILTQWNGHVGRLGQRFEVGDEIAQATMKDILIGLQLTLLTHLREDGIHLNILAVLNVSDLSRARTISAMHELYQRLAQSAPIPWQMTSPVAPGLPTIDPYSGLARYIGVITTLSSSQPPEQQPYPAGTTSSIHSYPSGPGLLPPPSPNATNTVSPFFQGSMSSSPPEMYTASHRPSVDAISPRETSSRRVSTISSLGNWLRERRRSSVESGERSDRDDRSEAAGLPSGPSSGLPSPPSTSYAEPSAPRPIPRRNRVELETHVEQNVLSENPWISVAEEKESEMRELEHIQRDEPQQYQNCAYPHTPNHSHMQQTHMQQTPNQGFRQGLRTPPPTQHHVSSSGPTLNIPRASQTPSIGSEYSVDSGSSNRSSEVIPISISSKVALWPPNRNNDYAGFCKGAWKQNSGFEGFKVHSVPIGYYTLVPKWKCVSCLFEMPMASPDSQSQSRSHGSNNPRFDEKVYTHAASGIRYRWSFLAKSHIASKTRPAASNPPKIGTFGCMFCCFENDRSVLAFGSLDVFMNHLGAAHRAFPGSLLGNTRCVVGRFAGAEEIFDINILPA